MKEIDELKERLKDTKISYSIGLYALALMIRKKVASVDELVEFIDEIEALIPDEYKTEMKSNEQLEELKSLFHKEVAKIECVFVDTIKEYMIGVVFKDKTYITIKSYEDIEKIKKQIENIKR